MTLLEIADKLRFYVMLEVLRLLPLPRAVQLITASAHAMYALSWSKRRKAIHWLRETVPPQTPSPEMPKHARELFVHAAFRRYLNYVLSLHDANDWREWLEVAGWQHVEQALARNRGVVLLTCHTGLPRLERWFLRTQPHLVYYLYRIGFAAPGATSWGARFQRWHLHRFRLDSDHLLGNDELSVQYMKKAYNHLRRNGIVSISGDGSTGERRYPVTICGRNHSFPAGGISLGLMAGAAILPCFTIIGKAPRFRLVFEEALALPTTHDPRDRTGNTRMLVEAYAARLEAYILRHPTNIAHPRYSLRIPA